MKRVLVSGDAITEHQIFRGERDSSFSFGRGTRICSSRGGAEQLHRLMAELARTRKTFELLPVLTAGGDDEAFAVWNPCPREKQGGDESVWRVTEMLGYGPRPGPVGSGQAVAAATDGTGCDLALLDDGGIRFRFDRSTWPAFLQDPAAKLPTWVVLKMADPIGRGDLWAELHARCQERLVVIVSAEDLRRDAVKISCGRSWESTCEDLLSELRSNAVLDNLKRCRHLIVLFRSAGALWVADPAAEACTPTLVFDPGHLEGAWEAGIEGTVLGIGTCIPAGVAGILLQDAPAGGGDASRHSATPDIAEGIRRGLAARRELLELGYGPAGSANADCAEPPAFPYRAIGAVLSRTTAERFSTLQVPDADIAAGHSWSFLGSHEAGTARPLYGEARRIVRQGTRALHGIPYGRFGALFVADRRELESLHSIQKLVSDYVARGQASRPLSLAVFGPPGAGKSFGIKQISKGILGQDVPILEFNLSQFKSPDMLIGALHQVRDCALKGRIPIVFWDEFDTQDLEWLQYLLAPMQDGAFLEGQISHPIGKCVFVFAGGTRYTMASFTPPSDDKRFGDFKRKKGPDFVSRLHGYLDVLGPNARLQHDPTTDSWLPDPSDVGYPIRRALLLRVMAGAWEKQPLRIDAGLLNAFLKVSMYRHGARSLETIIRLMRDARGALLQSNLPPRDQIGLHIDYDEFLTLIRQDNAFRARCKALAPAVHSFYRALAQREGWSIQYDVDYEQLPETIKADNVDAALRIPEVLGLVGLELVPADSDRARVDEKQAAAVIESNLELLAEAEHEGWQRAKFDSGWRQGTPRNDAAKIHDALIPYRKLTDENRAKDRDAVRNYPKIAARAGFRIVFED